jgi:hypothetical protein
MKQNLKHEEISLGIKGEEDGRNKGKRSARKLNHIRISTFLQLPTHHNLLYFR